jgi:hypothetical protein
VADVDLGGEKFRRDDSVSHPVTYICKVRISSEGVVDPRVSANTAPMILKSYTKVHPLPDLFGGDFGRPYE